MMEGCRKVMGAPNSVSAIRCLNKALGPSWLNIQGFVLAATLPEYRRREAASMILEYGTKMADENGWCMYADSTPIGAGMYPKHGFDKIGEFVSDLGKWGGMEGEMHTTVAFIRDPQGKEAEWVRR
ncbi:hypothetical protein V1521DRAFT_440284 [Lipomyces starkeyi]